MKKEIKETKTITTYERYCDICGEEIRRTLSCCRGVCQMCGKDLCEDCIGHEANSMFDDREVWCENCWSIGEEYREKIDKLEKEVDDLYEEWENKCKTGCND